LEAGLEEESDAPEEGDGKVDLADTDRGKITPASLESEEESAI